MKNIYKNLIIFLFLVLALRSHALLLSSPTDLTLNLKPESPRAGNEFTATAKSFVFEPARANFRWFLNGKEIASGRGLIEQTFTVGGLGSSMLIRVEATSAEGDAFAVQTAVFIGEIDFVIHPLTYTPVFYRGASLPTPGSIVEIFTLPHLFRNGSKIPMQNLIYEWSLDNKPVLNQSGEGRNKLVIQLADVGSSQYDVTLKTSSQNAEISFEKTLILKTYEPEVLFYETNSLTGVKTRAFSAFRTFSGSAFSIIAEPYYFDLASLAKAAVKWLANGEELKSAAGIVKNPLLLELSAPADTESQSNFSLSISDESTIFQRVEAALSVTASQ